MLELKRQKTLSVIGDYSYPIKIKILISCFFLLFLLIITRLFFLQVIQGDYFKNQALNNRKQIIRIPAYRGEMYINNGTTKIVENLPAYSLYLTPHNLPNFRKNRYEFFYMLQQITNKFNIPKKDLTAVLQQGKKNPYKAYLLKPNLSMKEVSFLAEYMNDFPGLSYIEGIQRNYRQAEILSHLTGYIRPISARELRKKNYQNYSPSSLIGKIGLEAYYDLELRGVDGYKVQIVDAKARIKEEHFPDDGVAVPGKDLFLTINSRIQNIIYKTLKGYIGGVIVTKVKTGEILGLYSYPDYNPNLFTQKINRETFNKYKNDKRNPFLNRVIQATYPPSSTYKLILSLIAFDVQNGFEQKKFTCYGGMYIGPTYFKCTGIHLENNYKTAIAYSCNTFFYKLGIEIGPELIHKYTYEYFNLGKRTGIDLPFEKIGRVPSQQWKLKTRGVFWWDGDTANFSIGQGYLHSSIIQINSITAAIAGNGIGYKPHLLKKSKNVEKNQPYKVPLMNLVNLPFNERNIKLLQNAMRKVVTIGTASRMSDVVKIPLAGKTGTAQNYQSKEPHSWFTAYGPYSKEKNNLDDLLAITVMIENGGSGSSLAAPFAAAIMEGIFYKKNPLLTLKNYFQTWKKQQDTYEEWLQIKNQKRLPNL